jgi:hypothetical protein
MISLKQSLSDWTDWDIAQYELAVVLGLIPEGADFVVETKHIFWSNHPLGRLLSAFLESLVDNDVLEFDAEVCMYRWKPGGLDGVS